MSTARTLAGWGYRFNGIKPFLMGLIFIVLGILAFVYLNLSTGIILLIIGIIGIIIGIIQWKTGTFVMKKL